jgi:transcriptional regulator with XRE-family HTH domain
MTTAVNKMTRAMPADRAGSIATEKLAGLLADNVSAARRRMRLSQDQLAARSGVSKGTIVQIEQGHANPSISSLCRIAVALGVSVEDLVSSPLQDTANIIVAREVKLLWQGPQGGSARLHIGTSGPNMLELWSWELTSGERYESDGHSPGTREIVYVQKGVLRIEIAGEIVELVAGSSATYEADRPHAYSGKARGLTVFTMVVEEPGSMRAT